MWKSYKKLLAVADAWKLFEREYLQEAEKKQVGYNVKDDVLYSSSGMLHCLDLPSSWVRLYGAGPSRQPCLLPTATDLRL